jgi:hypothetical protein
MIQYQFGCWGGRDVLRRIVLLGMCLFLVRAAVAQPVSPAENLLFLTNHMQNVREPVSLIYSFKKEGGAESGFEDEVHVDVTKINPDKSVGVSMRFLSGGRTLDLPQVGNASGNPALLGFLERDITEMKRLTGGSVNYFRKRIRLALAEAKKLHPIRFNYAGKQRDGQEVRIQPYLDDPLRDRLTKYVDKSYVFVISTEVPGGLYQIRTSSGNAADSNAKATKGKAAMTETLTLIKDRPLASAAGKGKR